MRACLVALVIAQLALACMQQMDAQAQEVQHPGTTAPNGDAADVAEQLVAQAEKWFEVLGAQGRVPRVFSGITPEARQFIVELDSLPFDHAKRRDFLIWLSQKYAVVAYAYATPVTAQEPGRYDLKEAL